MAIAKSSIVLIGTDTKHLRFVQNPDNLSPEALSRTLNRHVAVHGIEAVREAIDECNWVRFSHRVSKSAVSLGRKSKSKAPAGPMKEYVGLCTRAIVLGEDGFHIYIKVKGRYWCEVSHRFIPYCVKPANVEPEMKRTPFNLSALEYAITSGAFPVTIDVGENGSLFVACASLREA